MTAGETAGAAADAALAIRDHFRKQAPACDVLGSPLTATLCRTLAEVLDGSTEIGRRVLSWPGNARDDALCLIDNGGVLDLPLEPGVHQVSAKIDWCASPPMSVTIASGGVVELELGCNEGVWGGLGLLIALVFQSQKFLYLRTPLMPSM